MTVPPPGGKDDRPVRFRDGDGLYLQVAFGDDKSWLLRHSPARKARETGLVLAGEASGAVPFPGTFEPTPYPAPPGLV